MTTVDVEWDDETRASAKALDLVERSECPLCGLPSHVCQDTAHQYEFVQPPPVRCHATTARLVTTSKFTEETHPQHDALLWPTPELKG